MWWVCQSPEKQAGAGACCAAGHGAEEELGPPCRVWTRVPDPQGVPGENSQRILMEEMTSSVLKTFNEVMAFPSTVSLGKDGWWCLQLL